MADVLESILEVRRERVEASKKALPLAALEERAKKSFDRRPFLASVAQENAISIIAEMKQRSPSAGVLKSFYNPAQLALEYERGGAQALSVLTEPDFFGGSLEHMAQARKASRLPVLRKDFIFDSYQIFEARAFGADAVLLIADMLAPAHLKELADLAKSLFLEPLVEVFTSSSVPAALNSGASLIGVNTRDLRSLHMNPDNVFLVSQLLPKDRTLVAESGIKSSDDIKKLKSLRVAAVLVGEHLLKKENAQEAVQELVQAGKRS